MAVVFTIKEYVTPDGVSCFGKWFERLNALAASKVSVAITRIELGNFSNTKSVGAGVWEIKIDYGPGYRVYYAKEGDTIVILLAGGTKKTQQKDIEKAKLLWVEFKKRKKGH